MKIDEYGVLVSEIYDEGNDVLYAGNRADSMATTSRWIDLLLLLNEPAPLVSLQFITATGYQSHPSPRMPENLKETSISSDSALPYYLVTKSKQMLDRIESAKWCTGDGRPVSPAFFGALHDSVLWMSVCVLIQALIFKFPWRWDDGKKKFTSSANSSCDYLNWFHVALRCPRWVRRSVSKDTLANKISAYYKNEPNVAWLTFLYGQAIERYW